MVLAEEDSPAFLAGGTPVIQAMFDALPKLAAAFRGDGGVVLGRPPSRRCSLRPLGSSGRGIAPIS